MVRVWDIVAGTVLHSFTRPYHIHHMVYSRKTNRLAMVASSKSGSHNEVIILNPQTGSTLTVHHTQHDLTSLAFSQTAEELVCCQKTGGLGLLNVWTLSWQRVEHPDAMKSVSPLPNGTMVAHFAGSGVQLWNLAGGHAKSHQPDTISALPLYSLDEGEIIAVLRTNGSGVVLAEVETMSQLLEIPVQKTHITPTEGNRVFCASLENHQAAYCFKKSRRNYMQLWLFRSQHPKWTVKIDGLPSIGGISLTRVVTLYDVDNRTCVCVWDTRNGQLEAQLRVDPIHPLNITFGRQHTRFYFHHDTYRVPYDITFPTVHSTRPATPGSLIVGKSLPLIDKPRRRYGVDDTCDWVISGSKRICWIPPGYIGSVQPSYCWVGSSLFMAGQDGTLRKLTFQELV